jgi:hypothetical protein
MVGGVDVAVELSELKKRKRKEERVSGMYI